jgi:hypothetical protein
MFFVGLNTFPSLLKQEFLLLRLKEGPDQQIMLLLLLEFTDKQLTPIKVIIGNLMMNGWMN